MPPHGNAEPFYDADIVRDYFGRFTVAYPREDHTPDIWINGVLVDDFYHDGDCQYLRRAGHTFKWCSLERVDRMLCRFNLTLSDFEVYYDERGGVIVNDTVNVLAGD